MGAKDIPRLRDLAAGTFEGYRLDPQSIEVQKGFNARDFSLPENQEHVTNLAASIRIVGVQNPLVVRFAEGKAILVDGESRLRAVKQAIKEGAEIKSVPVIAEARHVSEEDRIASLLSRNTGKPLNMIERGEVFARLKNFGWTDADIATKTGITGAHVANILTLHSAPLAIKTMVTQAQVSATTALQTLREHEPQEAVKVLREAAKTGRVTAKDLPPATKKREKRNPLAFGRTDALNMFGTLCDIYFTSGDRRAQTMCRNTFEDIIGSDWKTIAHTYHTEHNEGK